MKKGAKQEWLIYGANGYTGELIAREAVRRKLKPILAGRNEAKVKALADSLGLNYRAFSTEGESVKRGLEGMSLVLNCAGPFIDTYSAFLEGCLANKTHYLDITGEISVFEGFAKRSDEAKAAGIILLPGVGFDVVPSDCLAKLVAEQLPSAKTLELAFLPSGGVSRGTAKTMLRHINEGNLVRRKGRLTASPLGTPDREIPFLEGKRQAYSIPWGDVSTAFYSTGVPDITVYLASSQQAAIPMAILRASRRVVGWAPVRNILSKLLDSFLSGPTESQRAIGSVSVWALVRDGKEKREAWLKVPEGYHFTAVAAVEAALRVLQSPPERKGFLTPSLAFGARFVTELPGVTLTGLPHTV